MLTTFNLPFAKKVSKLFNQKTKIELNLAQNPKQGGLFLSIFSLHSTSLRLRGSSVSVFKIDGPQFLFINNLITHN
jgi:hypothetical protein